MRREQRGQWVSGIEQHGRKFRFAVGVGAETTGRYSYQTREEADREQKKALKALERVRAQRVEATMEAALVKFRTYKTEERRNSPRAVDTELARVVAFFNQDSGPLPHPGPEGAKALYLALRQRPTARTGNPRSDAEHQGCLKAARRFGKWLVREKLWTSNPLTEVELTGKAKAGEESKAQFRQSEARVWRDSGADLARTGDYQAEAALACLLLGVRADEIASRQVRDVEVFKEGDKVLVNLYLAKTKNGKSRRVRVPAPLAALLIERIKGRFGLDPLYPTNQELGRLSRYSVRRAVRRICRHAGLLEVCPQGLRGTHASLAQEIGLTPEAVGASLGHGPEVDNRSYATADAQAAGKQTRMLKLLGSDEVQ